MDRFKPNFVFCIDITLWRFEKGPLFVINRGVKTSFPVGQNLYIDHIYGPVQTTFDMKHLIGISLGMFYGGHSVHITRCAKTRGSKPVFGRSNLY
jgi:hypothetical protein